MSKHCVTIQPLIDPNVPLPTTELATTSTDNYHHSCHFLRSSLQLARERQSWAEMRVRTSITCTKARAAHKKQNQNRVTKKPKVVRTPFVLVTEYQRRLGVSPQHNREEVIYESESRDEQKEEGVKAVEGQKIMLKFASRKLIVDVDVKSEKEEISESDQALDELLASLL